MRIGGASIAWVTLYGALCGVTALIPFFPYVGGGGYLPLLCAFTALAPIILGPVAGVVSALIGSVVGMLIAPAAFPLGLLDAILVGTLPAVFMAMMLNAYKRSWFLAAVATCIVLGVVGMFFPFWVPGASAGFAKPENPLVYWLLMAVYWLLPLIVIVSPVARTLIPKWTQGTDRKFKYVGFLIAAVTAFFMWFIPLCVPYWYMFNYSPAVATAAEIAYLWWLPALGAVVTIIAVPLVEALKRSGLPKVPGALW
jgi:predicted membrane protein